MSMYIIDETRDLKVMPSELRALFAEGTAFWTNSGELCIIRGYKRYYLRGRDVLFFQDGVPYGLIHLGEQNGK